MTSKRPYLLLCGGRLEDGHVKGRLRFKDERLADPPGPAGWLVHTSFRLILANQKTLT